LKPGSLEEVGVTPEDISQSLEGYAVGTQKESFFNLIRALYAIRQEKGRSNGKDLARSLELDAPQSKICLLLMISRVKLITLGESLWKEFWMKKELLSQKLPVLKGVSDTRGIMKFTLERQTNMIVAGGWQRLSLLVLFSHMTSMTVFRVIIRSTFSKI